MKNQLPFNSKKNKSTVSGPQPGILLSHSVLGVLTMGALLTGSPAHAYDGSNSGHGKETQVGDVFVIAMENHNFTQPPTQTSPGQIYGNPAAPYINSLLTPGNPNAAQVSYATAYVNAGTGAHPSEPNYVWAEAGSDFGAHTDADPGMANGNTFYDNSPRLISKLTVNGITVPFWHDNYTPHLTGQLNQAGVSWKNYEEDVELSSSPTKSAYGTNGPVNPYNGTTQFNYAAKHNPMAFFTDTALQNVFPLAQLFVDLDNNAVGQYNWITPDQYNDAHSTLNGGFTYNGTNYTGDAANIAQGDNFLSRVIPQIMASKAYQNNGVIIIWWDESEGGDDLSRTIQEVVISPLAKGNAYASSIPMNHSSDIKTMEEIFGLPLINNPIPATETNNYGGYNNVATVNDLSDLFVPGAIPASANLVVSSGSFFQAPHSKYVTQLVQIKNNGGTPVTGPVYLALDSLNSDVSLANADGTTAVLAPLGSPYVSMPVGDDGVLKPYETKTVKLQFLNPNNESISYVTRPLNVTPAP
jgi:phosphatidylinositol-3-phosphatase